MAVNCNNDNMERKLTILTDQGCYKLSLAFVWSDLQLRVLVPKSHPEEDCDVVLNHCSLPAEDQEALSKSVSITLAALMKQKKGDGSEEVQVDELVKSVDSIVNMWRKEILSVEDDPTTSADAAGIDGCGDGDVSRTNDHCPRDAKESKKAPRNAKRKPKPGGGGAGSAAGKEPTEKTPMKTSSDVISRIIWDPDLPAQHFIVGYHDRMLGIMERPFNEFDWSNFNQMDCDDTALPRHRIQYFKYRNAIVWDRAERRDAVFGSAGGPVAIFDIMRSEDEKEPFVDDSDSEPGDERPDDHVGAAEVLPSEEVRRNRKSPYDYFVALGITDPRVVAHIGRLQESLCEQFPDAVKNMIDLSSLHVTLLLLKNPCGGSKDEDALRTILQDESEAIVKIARSINVELSGLVLLKDRILCSGADKTPQLKHLMQHLHNILCKSGLTISDATDRQVHLTMGRFKKANRPEAVVKLREALGVSRFKCSLRPSSVIVKRIGEKVEPLYFAQLDE